jgi:NADPH:quinone reductase-like Zn-dependent oxidoreductase
MLLASNSPKSHIDRVISRLGISAGRFQQIYYPCQETKYAMKCSDLFWKKVLKDYPLDRYELTIIDDNQRNLDLAKSIGIHGIKVDPAKQELADAMLRFLKVHPSTFDPSFEFDEVKYLEKKNEVDRLSYSPSVRQKLIKLLAERLQGRIDASTSESLHLNVVDLGAGLLNMLDEVTNMISSAIKIMSSSSQMTAFVNYIAYEGNRHVWEAAISKLVADKSFVITEIQTSSPSSQQLMTKRIELTSGSSIDLQVKFVNDDFLGSQQIDQIHQYFKATSPTSQVDLIIGSCLADLFPPDILSKWLTHLNDDGKALLYLPITFCGSTMIRAHEQQVELVRHLLGQRDSSSISQYELFNDYHYSLQAQGHHLQVDELISELSACGCQLIRSSHISAATETVVTAAQDDDSTWKISLKQHKYLFYCMLRFIAHGTIYGIDARFYPIDLVISWLQTFYQLLADVHPHHPLGPDIAILAKNRDLLFIYPSSRQFYSSATDPSKARVKIAAGSSEVQAIEFIAARSLRLVESSLSALASSMLPNQILIEAEHSLISTGTELKIYRGDFDSDQALDTAFTEMKESSMRYPLRYGYCHVGKVIAVGSQVERARYLGQRVFSFSPHASHVIASTNDVMIVPEDISSLDAIFLPTIETAYSLVIAARPILGERLAVVGLGQIGLFTAAILIMMMVQTQSAKLHLFDVNDKRLAIAAAYLSDNRAIFINPSRKPAYNQPKDLDIDAAIEVSGHPSGLQTAIDSLGSDGRLIIGSWYGEKPVPLHLGLKFHRQGISTISSQVSNIPAALSSRWTKKRRFDVCWDLVRQLRPSQVFEIIDQHSQPMSYEELSTKRARAIVGMDERELSDAYESLDRGLATIIAIDYSKHSS